MKKRVITFVVMSIFLIDFMAKANAVSVNQALLHHDGLVTIFDGSDVQTVVDAAVDGDVIYLTIGSFSGFNVTKNISILGTGENSHISGNVVISIPNSTYLSNPILESLSISGDILIDTEVKGLTLRKCSFYHINFNASVDETILDKCDIGFLVQNSFIKNLTVSNTKLDNVYANTDATNNTTFINCNIYSLNAAAYSGTFYNSIICYCGSIDNKLNKTILVNTLISSSEFEIGSSSVTKDCYIISYSLRSYYTASASKLKSDGYLGTDGTVIGIYGGQIPFAGFEPDGPSVKSSLLEVDNMNRQLKVKLTISPQ